RARAHGVRVLARADRAERLDASGGDSERSVHRRGARTLLESLPLSRRYEHSAVPGAIPRVALRPGRGHEEGGRARALRELAQREPGPQQLSHQLATHVLGPPQSALQPLRAGVLGVDPGGQGEPALLAARRARGERDDPDPDLPRPSGQALLRVARALGRRPPYHAARRRPPDPAPVRGRPPPGTPGPAPPPPPRPPRPPAPPPAAA